MAFVPEKIIALANSKALIGLALISVVIIIVRRLLRVDYDPREPPLVPQRIPYIGHVIGMFRHGANYFEIIKYVSPNTPQTLKHHD